MAPGRRAPTAIAFLAAVAVGVAADRPAAGQTNPSDLLKYVPRMVNTVAVVNTQAILRSDRARREGWAKMDHTEYLAGAVPINPSIERLLLATEFVPQQPGDGNGLAVAPLDEPYDPEAMATARGGEVVEVADRKAVICPNGISFVPLKGNILGIARTNSTQDLSRWVRFAETAGDSKTPLQSEYLRQCAYATGLEVQILVGLDTEDLFTRDQAQAAAAANPALAQDQDTLDGISAFVGELRGVRFTANVRDNGLAATIRFDSHVVPQFPPEAFKGFVIDILEKNGAMLEDLRAAKAMVDKHTVILTLQVTDEELARIMSIVVPTASGVSESDVMRVTPSGVNLDATRKYYLTVCRILDQLRRQYKTPTSLRSYPRTAVWHDTAANKIQAMSVIGVDKAVADFGLGTAARLHEIANSLQGVPAEVQDAQSKLYYIAERQSLYRMGTNPIALPYGNNIAQVRAAQEQAINSDKDTRETIWSQIADERARVRSEVSSRLMGDIGAPPKR